MREPVVRHLRLRQAEYFYSDYVHMLGKVRVYSPEVMKVAAAWLRKAVRRMSKCVNVA